MTKVLAKGLLVASVATAGVALGARPGLAHNDWGLPLVGGLAGGFALSSMMHQREGHPVYAQPAYAAPAPTSPRRRLTWPRRRRQGRPRARSSIS